MEDGQETELLKLIRDNYGNDRFSKKQAKEGIITDTIRPGTIDRLFPAFISTSKLYVYQSSDRDSHKRYTLDPAKGGLREINTSISRRSLFGFNNPAHNSATGRAVLAKSFHWEALKNNGIEKKDVPNLEDWSFLNTHK